MKGEQLSLFSPWELNQLLVRPELSGKTSGSHHLSQLSRNRVLSEHLLTDVLSYSNLTRAHEAVFSNHGSSGIDGMSVEELGGWFQRHHVSLRASLFEGTYRPSPVRGVEIAKPKGGTRLLGIPTVIDRLIQQAMSQVLSRYYEPLFHPHSYGYRPNRSAHDALRTSQNYVRDGYTWVVELDLANFFDTIHHDRLMQRLSKGIGDKRLLRLIQAYLRTGILVDGVSEQRIAGTPQGSPLSPLLSNIVLDELDRELSKRGHKFCRYADDVQIYVRSEKAGHRVLASIIRFIEKKLKLRVNQAKSGVYPVDKSSFLGHTILQDGRLRIADENIRRMKRKMRTITKRNRGHSMQDVLQEVNQLLKGWLTYFQRASAWLPHKGLDGWIRRRLRCYRLKQCGRTHSIVKFLLSQGADKQMAWNAVWYTQGWWKLSGKRVCQHTMNIEWFRKLGLYSLDESYKHLTHHRKPP